ncbi:hypothetical protein OC845_001923 [Tilletia horrida]|nr:hypothetical protein OC845_001923 [Tilletia horrida]
MSSPSRVPIDARSESTIVEADRQADSQLEKGHVEPAASIPINALDASDNSFSKARVAMIVFLATLAAFISPMTANVFLPALPTVAKDLNVSLGRINLAVFIYMIGQGVSPLFLGGSDALGRRSIYIICFVLYSGANAGLANLPDGDFGGLLVLRFMQACGSASMIAIGAGVVNDVCTPKNRGSLMSIVQAGSTLGPAVGPVLGGIFTQAFGWRGTFWFTFVLGVFVLALVLFFLPETIALARENRRIPLPIRTAWVDLWSHRAEPRSGQASSGDKADEAKGHRSASQISRRILQACATPFRALAVVRQPEILLALLAFALPFACFYGLTVPLSSQFEQRYGLSTLQSGLVFLAPGFGVSLSAFSSGRLLDRSFRKVRADFETTWKQDPSEPHGNESRRGSEAPSQAPSQGDGTKSISKAEMLAFFPLEKARLEYYPYWTALMLAGFIIYGWTLEKNVYIAVPIISTFIVGVACGGQFSIMGCILVDYVGGKGASITAVNNLFRCLTGAIVSAVCQDIINAVGIGWTQTIFGFIALAATTLVMAMYKFGPTWRRKRFEATPSK